VPLKPVRDPLKTFRYAVYFDGVDDYVVIPLTVYGWSGITVQEWIYPFHPKANAAYSKFSMIGDSWIDRPAVQVLTDPRYDYTILSYQFLTRKPDGTYTIYSFSAYAYRNTWVNVARSFSLMGRVYIGYVNGGKVITTTIPSTEYTVLEWNPDTATYPDRYKRFVLGANTQLAEWMKMMQYQLLIYTRALSDSEIAWNFNYPGNPVRNGLYVWLQADPQYIKDIDGDGVLEWIDLSGYNNHGKIYGATLVQLVKTPARVLSPARVLPVAR
jgi:hypothetical protein